jgi:hypothetical protein
MTCRSIRIAQLAVCGLAVIFLASPASPASNPGDKERPASQSAMAVTYGKLPLSFEPNLGQTAKEVQWLARGPEYTLFLSGHDAVLELNTITPGEHRANGSGDLMQSTRTSVLRMNLLGANTADRANGEDPLPGKANYFTGNDPSKWQKDVPTFGKVRLQGVYPGIDLVYYGRQGQLEYDFVVSPGADPSSIRWGFDGATAKLAASGDLVLHTEGVPDDVRLNKPVVYQMKDGVRQLVDGQFVIGKDRQARFRLGSYDRSRELVIDPTLLYLGALGSGQGNWQSKPNGMAVDGEGEIVLTGATADVTFPVTTGAYQTVCNVFSALANQTLGRCPNGGSAFITKISSDGTTLIFSTYLHGASGFEYGDAVAIDSTGNEVVLGATSSYDFPITSGAYEPICQPHWNGTAEVQVCDGYFDGGGTEYTVQGPVMFVAKLDPTGENLLYSTFVGGTSVVYPEALALDSENNIYFTGFVQQAWAESNVYPNNGNQAIAFPTTTNAYQEYGQGQQAESLSVLKYDGSVMLYSTLFGSTDSTTQNPGYNYASALAVGAGGMAYIGGTTTSAALPTTTGVVKPHCVEQTGSNQTLCVTTTAWLAAFDTKDSGAASLKYATYIGGTETNAGTNNVENQVLGLHADSANNLFVTGWTSNIDFPTTAGTYQTTCNHANNANACNSTFLMKLNADGALTWSTYYGGTNGNSQSTGNAIAVDSQGWVYLYGYNNGYGWDLPLVNPLQPQNGNEFDFVATFTADAKQLLFATPIFGGPYAVNAVANNGMALGATGNIFVAGYGNDWGALVTTPGTFATPGAGSGWRGFFAKISRVLPWSATTLSISPATATAGQKVAFTATVAGVMQSTPIPTGTVTIENVTTTTPTTIGTLTLGSTGSGTFDTSSLSVGTYSVTANYPGNSSYEMSTSATQTLTITQGTPVITWPTPAAINYGTALSATQLDATSKVAGTFSYSPAATTVLPAGTHTLSVTFTPTDSTDYTTATASVTLTVQKATPAITWSSPAAITYGTALSATQLDATSTVSGTYVYSPAAGAKPAAGSHKLWVTFTPTDAADYKSTAVMVTLTVNPAVLTVTANNASRGYGAANPAFTDTIAGFVNGDTKSVVTGAASLTTTATASSPLGTYPIVAALGKLSAANYTFKFVNGTLTVTQAVPVVTWATPAPITYGTALSATQLDAKSSVAGTFVYSPPAGAKPSVGTHKLWVTFTPTNTVDYKTSAVTVTLTVNPAP